MPGSYGALAVQTAAVAGGLMTFGYLLADAAIGKRPVSGVIRWALALPALVAWAFVMMLLHLATGGRVFSEPWVVRGLAAIATGVLVIMRVRRRGNSVWARRAAVAAGLTVLVGLLVWGSPVARIVPLAPPRSDFDWHMGWASQLLNGETTPTSMLTGRVPNYYPWMFHALVAFAAAFTPGGRAYDTLPPLQLMQVAGTLLALFALGIEVGRSWLAGLGTALFGGLSGGFGYFLLKGFDLVISPRGPAALTYHGDLLFLRSYNVAFQDLAPPFPRDLAFALLTAYLLLLALGLSRKSHTWLVGAGCVLGLMGLTGGESLIVGVAVAMLVCLAPAGLRRRSVAASVFLPAAAIYAVWLVPLVISYVRLGGFVNTTIGAPVQMPVWDALFSWGLTTPVAIYGVVRWLPSRVGHPAVRVVGAVLVASVGILLGASLISGLLGNGFAVLSRQQRYWPMANLAVALVAGAGLGHLLESLARRRRWYAIVAGSLAVALAIPSPVVASVALPSRMRPASLVGAALLDHPSSLLAAVASGGTNRCVVAGPPTLVLTIFGYTGYRFVAVRTLGQTRNFARIRWRDIYDHITPEWERLADNRVLTGQAQDAASLSSLVARYGIDFLIVPRAVSESPAFQALPRVGSGLDEGFDVLRTGECGTS
jgi:hypothetical protein